MSPDYGCFVQAWTGYGAAVPIVRHFFGLSPMAHEKRIGLAPCLPKLESARLDSRCESEIRRSTFGLPSTRSKIASRSRSRGSDEEWTVDLEIDPAWYGFTRGNTRYASTANCRRRVGSEGRIPARRQLAKARAGDLVVLEKKGLRMKHVTLKDVAKAANVSITTASRALADYWDVSAETKARVQEVARRLGYTPNLIAQSLVRKETTFLGAYVDDDGIPSGGAAVFPSRHLRGA